MPILWKAVFLLVPSLVIIGIGLFVLMAICVWYGLKKRQRIFNARMKAYLLWSLLVFVSLMVYGAIGLNLELYLVEYVVVAVLSLVALFVAERKAWFFVSNKIWWIVFSLAVVFVLMFSYRWGIGVFNGKRNLNDPSVQCSYYLVF
jgi:hypothetical protein